MLRSYDRLRIGAFAIIVDAKDDRVVWRSTNSNGFGPDNG